MILKPRSRVRTDASSHANRCQPPLRIPEGTFNSNAPSLNSRFRAPFAWNGVEPFNVTLSIALDVLLKVNRWMNMDLAFFNTMPYITLVMKTLVAFGLAFQMPLLLLALGWFGIITSKMLAEKWRLAIVIVFVLAMVLTPPDPVSQIVMAIPMLGLYWLCIWLIRLRELAKRKRD